MEAQAIQPHLRVLEGIQHGRPGELLIAGGVVVILQAELDEGAFFLGQEFCGCRIVVHPEIRDNGHDDCQETLLLIISLCCQTVLAMDSPG